jgi:hypothetical protein
MKFSTAVTVTAAFVLSGTLCQADLIRLSDMTQFGSGLGNVNTIVTVLDAGSGPNANDIEGGCISLAGGAETFDCLGGTGVNENDNQAINNIVTAGDIDDFTNGRTIGAVVNINETGQDVSVVLTGLYLSFYDGTGALQHTAIYNGPDLTLTRGTGTGIGGSGFLFGLSPLQNNLVLGLGLNSTWQVGGGVQFAEGTAGAGPDTVYVVALNGAGGGDDPVIPEPGTYALLGSGLIGLVAVKRRLTKA